MRYLIAAALIAAGLAYHFTRPTYDNAFTDSAIINVPYNGGYDSGEFKN